MRRNFSSHFSPLTSHFLSESDARFVRLKTIFAQNRTPDFRLKRHMVVFAAMVADNIEPRRSVNARRRFFRAAFSASLRRHHISLIKNSLFFFGVNKHFFTLHARHFSIRHRSRFLLFLNSLAKVYHKPSDFITTFL